MRKREKINLFSYYNEKISDGASDSTFFVIPVKNNHETVVIGEKVKDLYRSNEF
jgi:hypothetical protein